MKKQVVLIMTDTQRKDMISCYNNQQDMNTPYLDSIASHGVMFQRAYTTQPVCGPARSALFTGYYPHTNGSFANSMFLNQGTKTIGQRLRGAGYQTAYIGKWHLDGGDYFGDGICPDGWDEKYWFDMRRYLDGMSEKDRYRSRKFDTINHEDFKADFTYAHQCSDKAIEYIKEHQEDDFFLVISYDEPHGPSLAPPSYFEPFKNHPLKNYGNLHQDSDDLPEHVRIRRDPHISKTEIFSRPELLGCNAYVDKEIGRVLAHLRSTTKNPCIFYTSDHGTSYGAHGFDGKGPAMYEEITNIPFMVEWEGQIRPGLVEDAPVSHIDVVPTVLDIFNIPIPQALEGRSLLPLLTLGQRVNDYVFMEFTRYEIDHDGFGGFQPIRAVTDGRYKLVINLMTEDEFYDTQTDCGEIHNLIHAPEYAQIRDRLHDSILKWMNDTRDPFRGYYWERRPWRLDACQPSWDYTGMTRQRITEPDEVTQLDYGTGLPITEYVRGKS